MDSFVQVAPDSSGKKIQTFEGTVSAETVEAQSVVLVDETLAPYQPLTDAELRATPVPVDGSGVTQPISAAALPLPSGAASEATLGGVLTTSDFDSKTGALTETAPGTDTASSGLNGRLQRIAQRISSLITALGSPFQAGGAIGGSSVSIPIINDPATQSLNTYNYFGIYTSFPALTGTLNSVNGISGPYDGGGVFFVVLKQTTPITTGAITFEISYDLGATYSTIDASNVTDPQTRAPISLPYTCQANTNKTFRLEIPGVNAVRIKSTTAITGGGTVTPVGIEPQAATPPLLPTNSSGVLKTDGSAVTQPTKEVRPATPAQSSVANSASSVSLLASNANRLGATIFNDDTAGTGATLKVKLGTTASATSFTVALAPQAYYEVPFGYTGAIDGIASAATGNARITELTA